ncbi:MAG: tRNA (N(6)-L-threonylcarbamoyladenosine(37)-C(2))-methylthiotransferase MtaB [Chitinivibrionales bacterium]|nr:tRNA (N(6)-L-threonylcarbamoyladenosine(37)-C(2))-methylthiotransferase MtaB [Chitinivibrionales bacterium]
MIRAREKRRCSDPFSLQKQASQSGTGKRIALKSLGCRTNQEELQAIAAHCLRKGYRIVNDLSQADIIIVNTCTVTRTAEAKSRRMLEASRRNASQAKILATGCLAQQKPEMVRKKMPVDWVVGNAYKDQICAIISESMGGCVHAPLNTKSAEPLPMNISLVPVQKALRTRFALKIQEGCDFRCTYCIVPSVRGPARSVSMGTVLQQAKHVLLAGYKEIVLTGTHIGQYHNAQSTNLVDLLDALVALEGDFRIRLSSIDPRDLSNDLLDLVVSSPKICNHLHVSVQSLSSRVVERMGRDAGAVESTIEKLGLIRKNNPILCLGGDFIVGFPGETDEMFEETMAGIHSAGFCYGHVFRFSSRPGTPAESFTPKVCHQVKNRRSVRLRSILKKTKQDFALSAKPVVQRILVQNPSPVIGYTSNYLNVRVPNRTLPKNSWATVTINDYNPDTGICIGEICSNDPGEIL